MFVLNVLFYILHLISLLISIESQTICLDNTNVTCNCNNDRSLVTCIENHPSDQMLIDWSTFSSAEHIYAAFNFINFTRLTPSTFTSFSSQFSSLRQVNISFINGIDQIAENSFELLNHFSEIPKYIRFYSPRNFQLDDYAFSKTEYQELTIDNIQYNDIYAQPYQLNLKAFDNTTIVEISILNSKEVQFIFNQSSTLYWTETFFNNVTLTNIDHLYDSLSSNSLTKLDLSSSGIVHFPSLVKFHHLSILNLRDNYISEVRSNLFPSENQLYEIDLSQNRIKRIAHDAFIDLHFLAGLVLNNNHLTSLETVTNNNEIISFLSPLNRTLRFLDLSGNFLPNLDALQDFSHLEVLDTDYNLIQKLNENTFKNARRLRVINLSHNQIEFIHPLVFNHTSLSILDLSWNPISSLETITTVYDEEFQPKNQTTSFLYNVASTLNKLSLANCTNLLEINWFVFMKLKELLSLDLSGITKTDRFWLLESNDSTPIQWNHELYDINILFHDIQFNNDDYCLSKPIFKIFNHTTLVLDKNHPCNCFLFMLKNIIYTQDDSVCLSNQSIIEKLAQECQNIDSYCLSRGNNTTVQVTTSTRSTSNDNGNWKIIIAIVIPSTVILLALFLVGIYIVKRRQKNKSIENVVMKGGIVNVFAKR
ncbi:hypothetical protein I4U23_016837 [Adineta vaga]|nr:hypothetical protein I4U23_016837 [Adineta vaga]